MNEGFSRSDFPKVWLICVLAFSLGIMSFAFGFFAEAASFRFLVLVGFIFISAPTVFLLVPGFSRSNLLEVKALLRDELFSKGNAFRACSVAVVSLLGFLGIGFVFFDAAFADAPSGLSLIGVGLLGLGLVGALTVPPSAKSVEPSEPVKV